MIDLHNWPTPNGWKITIFLEETTTPYTELRARPAIERALAVMADKRQVQGQLTDEARAILFGERQLGGR